MSFLTEGLVQKAVSVKDSALLVVTAANNSVNFSSIMNLLKSAVLAGGSIWLVIGAVILGLGLKNKEAPQIQSGIWQVVGGALITAAGAYLSSITF